MKNYKKILKNCFLSELKDKNTNILLRYRKRKDDKYNCEILIFDELDFRCTLKYVLEQCPTDIKCYTNFMINSTITNDSITFNSLTNTWWKEILNEVEFIMMNILDKEYLEEF